MKKMITFCFLVLGLGTGISYATNIYVDSSAVNGNETGEGWANAYLDLQDALAEAEDGDIIHVAEGTYKPDSINGDPEATFLIEVDLTLLGGYPSGGDLEPNPDMYETILSGDLNGDDVEGDFAVGRVDNVVTVVNIDDGLFVWIDGFTISNGHANGFSESNENGGGLFCASNSNVFINRTCFKENFAIGKGGGVFIQNSNGQLNQCLFTGNRATAEAGGLYIWSIAGGEGISSNIIDCRFEHNVCTGSGGGNGFGGAAVLGGSGTNGAFNLERDTFLANEAAWLGGGLGLETFTSASNFSFTVDSCVFENNHSQETGGGLLTFLKGDNMSFELSNSVFFGNSTELTGAGGTIQVDTENEGTVDISNCHFEMNSSNFIAGGLTIGGNGACNSYLYNCRFQDNEAVAYGGGLDIYCAGPQTMLIDSCQWDNNTTEDFAGGIGIATNTPELNVVFRNCRLIENSSSAGAALGLDPFYIDFEGNSGFTLGAAIRFENCLMTGNHTDGSNGDGGVILSRKTGEVELVNCTIAENMTDGIVLDVTGNTILQNTVLYNPDFTEFVSLTANPTIVSNGGNLALDASLNAAFLPLLDQPETNPLFENGYYPSEVSPLVNAGFKQGVVAETDLDGNPRCRGNIDIGAFESGYLVHTREVLAESSLQLYPNPAVEIVFVTLPEDVKGPVAVEIFDVTGKKLYEQRLQSNQSLPVANFPAGSYVLKLEDEDQVWTGQFQKK